MAKPELKPAGDLVAAVIPTAPPPSTDAADRWTCLKCRAEQTTEQPVPALCYPCGVLVQEERHQERLRAIPRALERAGIPPVFIRLDLAVPASLLAQMEAPRGFCLWGAAGVGKSMGMALFIREHMAHWSKTSGGLLRGIPDAWRWVDWVEFTMEMQDAYQRGDGERTALSILKAAAQAPLLAVDDIGAEGNKTPFIQQATYYLIDHREKWNLPTYITSNMSPAELDKAYGARVSDRIAQMCDVRQMTGKSRRLSGS